MRVSDSYTFECEASRVDDGELSGVVTDAVSVAIVSGSIIASIFCTPTLFWQTAMACSQRGTC